VKEVHYNRGINNMKLSVKSLTLTAAVLWSLCFVSVAFFNHFWPPYGRAFLDVMSSIYPGYKPEGTPGSVIIGTAYAFVDGAVGGALFSWLYNA
jgi:4-hydroxybenzoate polyprenyltransferase